MLPVDRQLRVRGLNSAALAVGCPPDAHARHVNLPERYLPPIPERLRRRRRLHQRTRQSRDPGRAVERYQLVDPAHTEFIQFDRQLPVRRLLPNCADLHRRRVLREHLKFRTHARPEDFRLNRPSDHTASRRRGLARDRPVDAAAIGAELAGLENCPLTMINRSTSCDSGQLGTAELDPAPPSPPRHLPAEWHSPGSQ